LPGIIGYPGRLEMLFGFPVDNQGVPGERLTLGYPVRFSNALRSARADYVFILGGSNDANHAIAPAYFRAQLQKLINIARTMGVEPILLTVPPACCDRGGLTTFTRLYSQEVRFLASVNETLLADIEMGFDQECPNTGSCYLLNRPEGLHPNTAGYNFIAEVVGDATIGPDEMGIVEEEPTADEEVEVTP
ncbi:MAG: SGNH/GDSL hydrolase family protein, partial [Bdellovibrionales bacterium]|nr:SGNH/GDSL hydrolase family protein [Bdellovibrionales bacterium]